MIDECRRGCEILGDACAFSGDAILSSRELGASRQRQPFAIEETVELLFQALITLEYLHPRGVAHRDLKPANILVISRYSLRVKLANFGLANDKSELKTICGTPDYSAPEIYFDSKYQPSVDLWSLGVIALEYVYSLPEKVRERPRKHQNQHTRLKNRGLSWCNRTVDFVNGWDSEPLLDLLTTAMLKMEPNERLSAGQCLKKGYHLGLFDGHTFDSGNVTPTQQAALQHEISDGDDSTTIILGALWGTSETSIMKTMAE